MGWELQKKEYMLLGYMAAIYPEQESELLGAVNEPERYPKGYYGFSSKVRFHVFMGQRLTYDIDPQRRFLAKSVTFFYEISTCDLYVISAVNNSYLRPRDYLSLSFGLKFQWL